jgi:hypothetical protein
MSAHRFTGHQPVRTGTGATERDVVGAADGPVAFGRDDDLASSLRDPCVVALSPIVGVGSEAVDWLVREGDVVALPGEPISRTGLPSASLS